jgi:hypothetical protein
MLSRVSDGSEFAALILPRKLDAKTLGIPQKLLLEFGGLVIALAVVGYESITFLTQLRRSIDVIVLENCGSVRACREMKDATDRTDGGKKKRGCARKFVSADMN